MKMRIALLVLPITFVVAEVASAQVGELSQVRTNVPIELEGSYWSSSLAVTFYEKQINQTIGDWSPSSQPDLTLRTLLEAIRTTNAANAFPILSRNPRLNTTNQVEKFISAYNRAFAMQTVKVVSRVPAEDRSMFVWEVDNSGMAGWSTDRWIRRAFIMVETNGSYVCDYTGNAPVQTFLLNDVLQQVRNRPELFEAPLPSNPAYSVPLIFGTNSVRLEFNGVPCNLSVANPQHNSTNAVAQFYLQAYRLLTNANPEHLNEFCQKLTPVTRNKMQLAVAQWPAEKIQNLQEQALARKVVFVLDAQPVYVVFYLSYEVMHHEYVIREGADSLLLTSLFNESFLDEVLNSVTFTSAIGATR